MGQSPLPDRAGGGSDEYEVNAPGLRGGGAAQNTRGLRSPRSLAYPGVALPAHVRDLAGNHISFEGTVVTHSAF